MFANKVLELKQPPEVVITETHYFIHISLHLQLTVQVHPKVTNDVTAVYRAVAYSEWVVLQWYNGEGRSSTEPNKFWLGRVHLETRRRTGLGKFRAFYVYRQIPLLAHPNNYCQTPLYLQIPTSGKNYTIKVQYVLIPRQLIYCQHPSLAYYFTYKFIQPKCCGLVFPDTVCIHVYIGYRQPDFRANWQGRLKSWALANH